MLRDDRRTGRGLVHQQQVDSGAAHRIGGLRHDGARLAGEPLDHIFDGRRAFAGPQLRINDGQGAAGKVLLHNRGIVQAVAEYVLLAIAQLEISHSMTARQEFPSQTRHGVHVTRAGGREHTDMAHFPSARLNIRERGCPWIEVTLP